MVEIDFQRKKTTVPINIVLSGINEFYNDLKSDENARYLSWEHCYKAFQEAYNRAALTVNDMDYLSLHLAFYLASWGMLRGSSFLLQKDYRVHLDIIKELYKPCYNNLWGIDCIELQKQQNLQILMKLIENLKNIYNQKRSNIKEVHTSISNILVTKVLLGTLGCVPAYDQYFKNGIGKYNITVQLFGETSIIGLAKYYEENKTELENIRKIISKSRQIGYPQMKILDMAFWKLGFEKNN
ncbi:hypothetical protein [Clostridium lundense]|uniref:hypothetical protein n=1 Tax=Clostridium lundense TaxID=319475 RepID=UPI0006873F1E|nr:hypothetical protein [Clostridium lundense]